MPDAGLQFLCYSKIDAVDAQTLGLMKAAGFRTIVFGVESFSDSIVLRMGKKIRGGGSYRAQAMRAIEQTIQSGITATGKPHALFYPSVTLDDMWMTVDTAVALLKQKNVVISVAYGVMALSGARILEPESGFSVNRETFTVNMQEIELPFRGGGMRRLYA